MKNVRMAMILIIGILITTVTTDAQRASVSLNKNGTFIDGTPGKVTWAWNKAPVGTVVEVSLVSPLGFGYTLLVTDSLSGSTMWMPRVLYERTEYYFVRVTWGDGHGTVYAVADTGVFKITLPSMVEQRSMDITSPTDWSIHQLTDPLTLSWQSANLPAGATVTIWLQPYNEDRVIDMWRTWAEDGTFTIPSLGNVTDGWYALGIAYTTEYGVYSVQDTVAVYINNTVATINPLP